MYKKKIIEIYIAYLIIKILSLMFSISFVDSRNINIFRLVLNLSEISWKVVSKKELKIIISQIASRKSDPVLEISNEFCKLHRLEINLIFFVSYRKMHKVLR